MNNSFEIKPINCICPKCRDENYMRIMYGANIGKLNVKCINCNSYFRYEDISQTQSKQMNVLEDLKLALAGWYCALDDEWSGEGEAWDDPDLKAIMDKYGISKEDIKNAMPSNWTC